MSTAICAIAIYYIMYRSHDNLGFLLAALAGTLFCAGFGTSRRLGSYPFAERVSILDVAIIIVVIVIAVIIFVIVIIIVSLFNYNIRRIYRKNNSVINFISEYTVILNTKLFRNTVFFKRFYKIICVDIILKIKYVAN